MKRTLMLKVKHTYEAWTNYMKTISTEAGIPDSYRMVLMFLLRHPGTNQKDIVKYRNITPASVSQIVKEMQFDGYLRKETADEDQRYVKLYLTEKGIQCAKQIDRRMSASDEKIRKIFTLEKETQMMELLDELYEIIEKELPKC